VIHTGKKRQVRRGWGNVQSETNQDFKDVLYIEEINKTTEETL